MGGGCWEVSANEYTCAHGAQINFGDLTPYLTYAPFHQLLKLATSVSDLDPEFKWDSEARDPHRSAFIWLSGSGSVGS